MAIQTRTTALRSEYVRLYCRFIQNGILMDPSLPPVVFITNNNYYQESSSSSSSNTSSSSSIDTISTSSSLSSINSSSSSNSSSQTMSTSSESMDVVFGPFTAQKEHNGLWYVDWLVPATLPVGRYFDVWKFKWPTKNTITKNTYEINVYDADNLVLSTSPAITYDNGDTVYGLINDLENNFIYEAMHIPVYWEQGYKTGRSNAVNFAFGNWNKDPRPIVRINQTIHLDGWEPNYNGNIYFNTNLDVEDMVYAQYNFRYFKKEEIIDFLIWAYLP